MALLRKINSRAQTTINTGFGVNASDYGGRFVNKKGRANIETRGVGFLEKISWYHSLLGLPRLKFFLIILVFFVGINFLFAIIYFLAGVQYIGVTPGLSAAENFADAFFFSCQTFTTVGYGRLNPTSIPVSFIASFEALMGWLSLAVATSLLYGRFAKPTAYLRFSANAIIAPYQDITALMFRVAPYKNTSLIDAEAKVSLGIMLEEDGKTVNKFYQLPLEYNVVNSLALSWTIVHPITEESPLYKFIREDYSDITGEILVFIKAFDDMFSSHVVARTSYTFKELIIGAKFQPMYHRSKEGNKTILDLEKLNAYKPAEVSFTVKEEQVTG
ncbi:MAG: irk [Chitinophagaceae bacterium]|nr:irk [Chitinophagaceae bacterium]